MSSQPDHEEPSTSSSPPVPASAASNLAEGTASADAKNKPLIRIGTQRYGVTPPKAVAQPLFPLPDTKKLTGQTGEESDDDPHAATSPAAQEGRESSASADAAAQESAAPESSAPAGAPSAPGKRKDSRPQKPKFTAEPQAPRKFPPPNIRGQLSPDLELEFVAALGDQPLDDMLGSDEISTVAELELESKHQGKVIAIHRDDVFVEIAGRQQGTLPLHQFPEPPPIGAVLDVVVGRYNAAEGLYELIVPGGAVSVEDWSQVSEGLVVEARVTGHNKGGLECEVNRLRGFIPASQISMYRVEDLAQFVDQKFNCVITEANPEKRNLVLSRRAVLEREKAESKERLLAELAPGQVREGTVRSLQDFGAFVDLGGVDGLIHISQLSWDRIKHASEVLELGQTVKVKITKIDPQTGKIGLAFRDLADNPWASAARDFPVRSTASGKVTRLMDFGAFVRLAPGVEGLVHISELSHKRVFRVSDVLSEGKDVEVMVLSVDAEQQRMSLSMKALEAKAPPPQAEPEEPAAEEAPPPAAKKRNVPLKGGIGGPSTGEQFGLKW